MLTLKGLEVIRLVLDGCLPVREVSSRLSLSRSAVYDLLRDMRRKGLVELRNGVVSLASTTHARALALAIEEKLIPNPRLLSEKSILILLSAPRPMDIGQVRRLTFLSKATFHRWFRMLVDEGWMTILPHRMTVSCHLVNGEGPSTSS